MGGQASAPAAKRYVSQNGRMKKNSELWNMRNAAIIGITYITVAVAFSQGVMSPGNEAANTIEEKVVLLVVGLLVVAPGMAIGMLAVYLRSAHFIRTRDILEFLSPSKGSPGNPIIDGVIGKWGVWAFNAFVKFMIAVWVMLFAWMVYGVVRRW